jgi:hypothetical protein
MATDIALILNKKGWTGDEVGKAIIYSLIDSYKQVLQGKAVPTGLFTAAKLKKMVNALEDSSHIRCYNRYIGLNNWLTQYQAVASAYYQQADGAINRLLEIMTTINAIEDEYKYIEKLPATMTQKQYEDAIEPYRPNKISIVCGLEQFTSLNKTYVENIERLERSKTLIEDGYYYLMAYDKAIELITDYIDIPEFTIFKIGHEAISERINSLNERICLLGSKIKTTDYGDNETKEIKLQVLRNHFQPLKGKEQILSEKSIKRANALLNDNMKAFETQDGMFINILTARTESWYD